MTVFELIIIVWLLALTAWLYFFKHGPKGDKGTFDSYEISCWHIKEPAKELLEDSEYITSLIKKINSLQLTGGKEV